MTTDYNVARVPTTMSPQSGAAIGVAFVAAALAIGISLGVDFANVTGPYLGPNLVELLKELGRNEIEEDVVDECFDSMRAEDRPKPGDWFAIWGGEFPNPLWKAFL